MPIVFNGTTRQIEVTDSAIFELEAGKELYSAWKRWQQLDPANAGQAPAFRTFGGDPTATGQFAPKYFFLINYWTVLINNGNIVTVALNLYSDDFVTPYVVVAGSGVSDRNSDAVSVNSAAIEFASFEGGVTIDVIAGEAGTGGTRGTKREPSNNVLDALSIAATRGLNKLFIIGDITFTTGHDLTSFQVFGESSSKTTITVNPGAVVDGIEIYEATVTGTLDANGVLENCVLDTLAFFEGIVRCCAFNNVTITLGGTATTHLVDCHTNNPSGTTIIDMGGGGRDFISVGWTGRIKFINMSTANLITCERTTGKLEYDSTITNGTLTAQGQGLIVDNSTGTTLINPGFMNRSMIADSNWDKDISGYTVDGQAGYELQIARLQAALAAALSA